MAEQVDYDALAKQINSGGAPSAPTASTAAAAPIEPDFVKGLYGYIQNPRKPGPINPKGPVTVRDEKGQQYSLNVDRASPVPLTTLVAKAVQNDPRNQQSLSNILRSATTIEPGSASEVRRQQANSIIGGIGDFVMGIPGMVKDTAVAASEMNTPEGMQKNVDRGVAMLNNIADTGKPLLNDAVNLGKSLLDIRSNTPQSTPQEQQNYANAAGQFAAPLAIGAAVDRASGPIGKFMTPEARMAAADAARANIEPIGKPLSRFAYQAANANPLNAATAGADLIGNLAGRVSAPINERLATILARGRPFGINQSIPTGAATSDLAQVGGDKLNIARPQPNIPAPDFSGASNINTSVPSGAATADQAIIPQEKLNIPRPPPQLARAIADFQAKAPAVLDGPTINKWMGTRPANMMRGADPGARLVNEGLIGVDKTATASNVHTALGEAGADLQKALDSADAKGLTLDGKAIIDNAIADATKKFGIKSDENFMKQIEQVSTDAASEFDDLSALNASRTHELKVRIGDSIDWKTSNPNPFNDMLKNIYRTLNNGLGDISPEIRKTQLRWGDLNQASKALHESLVKDLAGRGTGADLPTVKK